MSAAECPEMALIAAVISQAVRDLGYKEHRVGAQRWIDDPSRRAFGFAWCCEDLGLDPEWARATIYERKSPLLKAR